MSVSARDPDTEAKDNVLQYSVLGTNPSSQYFYATTDPDSDRSNVGIIRVKQVRIFLIFVVNRN